MIRLFKACIRRNMQADSAAPNLPWSPACATGSYPPQTQSPTNEERGAMVMAMSMVAVRGLVLIVMLVLMLVMPLVMAAVLAVIHCLCRYFASACGRCVAIPHPGVCTSGYALTRVFDVARECASFWRKYYIERYVRMMLVC